MEYICSLFKSFYQWTLLSTGVPQNSRYNYFEKILTTKDFMTDNLLRTFLIFLEKLFYPFKCLCPLKGHTYLNKPAYSLQLQVCLSMCDLLVDIRHYTFFYKQFNFPIRPKIV